MTNEEAIKFIYCFWAPRANIKDEMIEIATEAIKKRIRKKPRNKYEIPNAGYRGCCPSCGNGINHMFQYCDNCGQAIDWSDIDDK